MREVKQYLQGVGRFKNELEELCQLMHLTHPFYESKQLPSSENEARIFLDLNPEEGEDNRVSYQGRGLDFNHREAFEKASRQVLKQVFVDMPEMWAEFVKRKAKKGRLMPSW